MKSNYDPHKHHRRSIRLKGYDYSQAGAYFITICTRHMACLFGTIENDELLLNDAGKMINEQWLALADRFPNIQFGEYITMPNHFHAILIILDAPIAGNAQAQEHQPVRAPLVGAPNAGEALNANATLGEMIGAFKSITTNEYIIGVKNQGWQPFNKKLWHRNYYEHIIRDEVAYLNISNYIRNNPTSWKDDTYFK